MTCQLFSGSYLCKEQSQTYTLPEICLNERYLLRVSKLVGRGLLEPELLYLPERVVKFLFPLFICAKWNFIDTWICGPRLPVRGKIIFSIVSTATISFPLFPAAFQQLILESLQVFHNSDGIFASCRSLSMADGNGILHISNCGFIIRGNCGML